MAGTKLLFFTATLLVQGIYCKISLPSFLEDDKIVGGNETSITKFPYQVIVAVHDSQGRYVCGGSILNEEYILTAAHCVYGMKTAAIRAGLTNKREPESKVPLIPAKRFMHHPLYNETNSDYDVGFIQLSKKLNLHGPKEKAVHIVQAGSEVPVGAKVIVSGWGLTKENGTLSDVLRAVELNIVSVFECRKVYGKKDITQRMICAGVPKGGKDNCQGDSGGPLVYSSTRKQVGIVSSGYGCARPGVPGIYTNLANPGIRSWIKKHTGA
ncbi:trypsin-7-like isoform X6 [Leptidea sinapis]|uniref:trypsin-7-like isoform X6 n=1 Tax=Leptidea sinapis TaxID=189913 RepID=UPI0021C46F1B|nr:trypsin-7-like isoform X6 [Leptidea sinapis]